MAEAGLPCSTCGRQTLHRRREANDVLYAILTLFSCGLFGIIWVIEKGKAAKSPWLCTTCGTATVQPERPPAPSVARRPMSKRDRFIVGAILTALAVAIPTAGFLQYRSDQEEKRRTAERAAKHEADLRRIADDDASKVVAQKDEIIKELDRIEASLRAKWTHVAATDLTIAEGRIAPLQNEHVSAAVRSTDDAQSILRRAKEVRAFEAARFGAMK